MEQPENSQIKPYCNIDTTGPIKMFNRPVPPHSSSSLIKTKHSRWKLVSVELLRYDRLAAESSPVSETRPIFTVAQRVLLRSRLAQHWLRSETHCLDNISPPFSRHSVPPTLTNAPQTDQTDASSASPRSAARETSDAVAPTGAARRTIRPQQYAHK